MDWIKINTQEDIDNLLEKFNRFHDSCLVSLSYVSGSRVNKKDFSMLPFNIKRTLKVEFQSQFEEPCSSIEMKFDKLIKLNLEPIAPRYTCDILEATIKKVDNYFCWADTPPDFDINDPPEGTWIICEDMYWREI